MKKVYAQPSLEVVFINKDIRTDIITVSNQTYGAGDGEKVFAPDRFYHFDNYYEGY